MSFSGFFENEHCELSAYKMIAMNVQVSLPIPFQRPALQ